MEWFRDNAIGIALAFAAFIGIYVAMEVKLNTALIRLETVVQQQAQTNAMIKEAGQNVFQNSLNIGKQSVLLEGISKIVQRNIDKLDDADRRLYGLELLSQTE